MQSSSEAGQLWRNYLNEIFAQNPKLVRLLAEELGLTPITLQRWARHEATPHNLVRSLQRIAEAEHFQPYREQFMLLAQREHPDIAQPASLLHERPVKEIPSDFYSDILGAYVQVSEELAFWTIAHLVSQQLCWHLDPDQHAHLSPTIFCCTPSQGRVHSLYTPTDQRDNRIFPFLSEFPLLLGGETEWSQALLRHQPMVFCSLPHMVAVQSIQRRGKIGGLLVIHSEKLDLFTPAQLTIISEYARAITLALEESCFYPPAKISLAILPSIEEQINQQKQYPFARRLIDLRLQHPQCTQPDLLLLALQALEHALRAAPGESTA
ncbi:MAG: hypothetical protein J2P36_40275 [Ktedonobacteraceae bacterium]|nr:hypothetical protein [Ktedonobacteraceae bacterium]